MSDFQEAVEKEVARAVKRVKERMEQDEDDSDESFEYALDSVFSNDNVEEPLVVEVCRLLGRDNPWR